MGTSPLKRNSRKAWRADKGQVPGVAIQCKSELRAIPVEPSTPQGISLYRAGRLVLASVLLGSVRAILGSVYMPPANCPMMLKQRATLMHMLSTEVEAHLQIPFLLGGDWNCPPTENMVAAEMSTRGWQLPMHINLSSEPCPVTFQDDRVSSCLDYWLVSPAVGPQWSQIVREHPGHRHRSVSLRVQPIAKLAPCPMALPPISYEFPSGALATCSPNDWEEVSRTIQKALDTDQIDSAWETWQQAYHQEMISQALSGPSGPPGNRWYTQRRWSARVTSRGEESHDIALMYATARRLLDFGKHGGARARRRISKGLSFLRNHGLLQMTDTEALTQPLCSSEHLFSEAQRIQQSRKKAALWKWEKNLIGLHQRPNPCLYRWLKGEAPAAVVALETAQGPTQTMDRVFQEHRTYWEDICTGPTSQDPSESLSDATSDSCGTPLQAEDLLAVKDRVKKGTAPGLDNWPAEAVARISQAPAAALAILLNWVEVHGRWPTSMLRIKVALINKPGVSGTLPAHWRPLSVSSVWYRLYAQARLPTMLATVLPHLPESVMGGIPGRIPSQATLNLLAAFESHAHGKPAPALYGVALDASKCFDRVRWGDLWRHLAQLSLPQPLLRAMKSFYATHARHTVIRGHLDVQSWKVSSGLLQGCPLSVLATVSLVATWHQCIPVPTLAQSFIDDRLLLSPNPHALSLSWKASETWNQLSGWKVNLDKTVAFFFGTMYR